MPKKQTKVQYSSSDSDSSAAELEFSGDEAPVTWKEARKFKLAFGDYKGKRLDVMILTKKRRNLLRYYLKWDKLRSDAKVNIEAALAHYESLKEEEE